MVGMRMWIDTYDCGNHAYVEWHGPEDGKMKKSSTQRSSRVKPSAAPASNSKDTIHIYSEDDFLDESDVKYIN